MTLGFAARESVTTGSSDITGHGELLAVIDGTAEGLRAVPQILHEAGRLALQPHLVVLANSPIDQLERQLRDYVHLAPNPKHWAIIEPQDTNPTTIAANHPAALLAVAITDTAPATLRNMTIELLATAGRSVLVLGPRHLPRSRPLRRIAYVETADPTTVAPEAVRHLARDLNSSLTTIRVTLGATPMTGPPPHRSSTSTETESRVSTWSPISRPAGVRAHLAESPVDLLVVSRDAEASVYDDFAVWSHAPVLAVSSGDRAPALGRRPANLASVAPSGRRSTMWRRATQIGSASISALLKADGGP